jgi:hypothetical protein
MDDRLIVQKVVNGGKGGSRLSFDFGAIAISAAGERDLEGRFSPLSRRLRFRSP